MENSRVYTIFAGINGAGKSTLYYTLEDISFGIRLNSDEVVEQEGKDWKDWGSQLSAGKKVIELQRKCLEEGYSMNRETTLADNSIFLLIDKLREKDYQIQLFYVGVDSLDIAKKRVKERVMRGGHGVPENVMESRYRIMQKNIVRIIPHCDKI